MNIKLSRGYTARVSREDYVRVVDAGPWFAHVDSKKKTVYAERNVQRADGSWTMQKLHRFLLGLTDPKVLGDHKDGDGLNNLRSNLREANPMQSQRNRGMQSNNSTGVSGVSWNTHAAKYEVHVKLNGKKKHLGLFSPLEDAEAAIIGAKKLLYGEFVRAL
jgi:hypothetical protein